MSCTVHDPCLGCRSGFHNECSGFWTSDTDECGCGGAVIFTASGEVKDSGDKSITNGSDLDTGYVEDGYDGYKDIDQYKDPLSTGRKRAAVMYPITTGQVCEWAGLKYAGGGIVPIVGCVGRPASDRHHGPDKNTMNNAPGNVHRICDHCHNTWHGANDVHYGERPDHTLPFVPNMPYKEHDADTKATMEEIIAAEQQRIADM